MYVVSSKKYLLASGDTIFLDKYDKKRKMMKHRDIRDVLFSNASFIPNGGKCFGYYIVYKTPDTADGVTGNVVLRCTRKYDYRVLKDNNNVRDMYNKTTD